MAAKTHPERMNKTRKAGRRKPIGFIRGALKNLPDAAAARPSGGFSPKMKMADRA
jgi:hypothetical protein